MRYAILSDIQGNMAALEAVWAAIGSQSVDAIYCTGDLVGLWNRPNEVIEFIRQAGIATVMGDFDEIVGFDLSPRDYYHPEAAREEAGLKASRRNKLKVGSDQKRYLRSLPLQLRETWNGQSILMVHGSPRSLNEYVFKDKPRATFAELAKYAGCDLIIFGHTGQAYVKQIDRTWFINAGSVGGLPDDEGKATYWLIDLQSKPSFELQVVRYRAARNMLVGARSGTANRRWTEVGRGQPQAIGTRQVVQRKGKVQEL